MGAKIRNFNLRFFLILFIGVSGLGKDSQAATINVVDQDDPSGRTPSCDNNVQGSELAPALTASNWSAGAGWSVSGGQITFRGTSTETIYPSTPIPDNTPPAAPSGLAVN